MIFVKFCGMTREQDVETAVALGVDAVGFVLWPDSPRAVTFARLASLTARIPAAVCPVAVFVRPARAEIDRATDAGVRAIQLHGVTHVPTWPTTAEIWIAGSLVADGVSPAVPDERVLVLDAHDPQRHGGTGQTIDWTRAATIAARRRVLLAGGLTPANVAEAVRLVRPFGVDVASGIESRPGIKDPIAMQNFITRVRQVTPS